MVGRKKYWCPKGCGKKVVYVKVWIVRENLSKKEWVYQCLKCKISFKKGSLKAFKEGLS